MPKPRQQKHDTEVEIGPRGAFAIAAERNVDIVAKPARQGHMPASPELGDGTGSIRIVEILREAETEDPAEPDGHVRIGREIEIELQRISDYTEPGDLGAEPSHRDRVDLICHQAERVGDQCFLRQPGDKTLNADGKIDARRAPTN
ncbi:hypothetical protein MnTg02_01129 [bacterium MnTg02]|nr:hypothetical protein MnTg02_01129 [bacterium MnTg02]